MNLKPFENEVGLVINQSFTEILDFFEVVNILLSPNMTSAFSSLI